MPRLRFSLPICALVIGCSAQPTDPSVAPDLAKGGAGSPGAIASVVVSPETNVLRPGWTQQLTATAKDANDADVRGVTFKWITSNPAVATVTKGGLLTAVASSGPVTITAQTNTKQPIRGSAVVAVLSNRSGLASGGGNHQGHTCALDAVGMAWCWGSADWGQLGNPGSGGVPAPTRTADQTPLVSLIAGARHTCGLDAGGMAYCWGTDDDGQIGQGTSGMGTSYPSPTPVQTPLRFESLAPGGAGVNHTCGLVASGEAYCWGLNDQGALGDGTDADYSHQTLPTAVVGGLSFVALSVGGRHSCGLTAEGKAYCWGHNASGAIGTGSNTPTRHPTPQPVLQDDFRIVSIVAGWERTFAITTTGTMYGWGEHVGLVPRKMPGEISFQNLTVGGWTTCGLDFAGEAYCFGSNPFGQLGNGTSTGEGGPIQDSYDAFVKVLGALRFSAIAGGDGHMCARGLDGLTYCWGYNVFGQLGDGAFLNRAVPGPTRPYGQ